MKHLFFLLLVFSFSPLFSNTSEVKTFYGSAIQPTVCTFEKAQESNEPLIIIDGKVASKKELDQCDPNTIDSVSVLKGDKGMEKYGEKGKNGVIEIITKKHLK